MTRTLLLSLTVLFLAVACSDDDCPVTPISSAPATLMTGTWTAAFETTDGFIEREEWIMTQTDSTVTAIIRHGTEHGNIFEDTLTGTIHSNDILVLSRRETTEITTYEVTVNGVVNGERNVLFGGIFHSTTEWGHTSSKSQGFSAEKK